MTVEMREVLCVAVLAALLAVGHAGSFKGSVPPKPKVPNSFVAHITLYATKSPIGSGIMYYALNQSAYSVSVARMEPFTGLQLNTSMYFVEDGMFMVTNDACRPFNDSKFYNMFDWVNSPDATYAGQKQVDGRTCDEWVLDVSTAFLSQCVIGNIPVRSSVLSKTMNTGTTQIYHTFTPGKCHKISATLSSLSNGLYWVTPCVQTMLLVSLLAIRVYPTPNNTALMFTFHCFAWCVVLFFVYFVVELN
eukprot:m.35422 g.35422  ORF g.35422 m.35422 type:complete len:248 (+) comp9889_c0_seq2:137-880(+)